MNIVDQDVRREVVESIDQSYALSAGAGSGKTSVLTARLVEVLASGVHPQHVAAITFTEKAASELKERVRDLLEEKSDGEDEQGGLIRAALDAYGDLSISTIHSFCKQLLLEEPLAAAFPPATEAGEDFKQDELAFRSLKTWKEGFAQRHPTFAPVVLSLAKTTALKEAAKSIVARPGYELIVADGAGRVDVDAEHKRLCERLQAFLQSSEACESPDTCKLYRKTDELRQLAHRLLQKDASEAVRIASTAIAFGVKAANLGSKNDWGVDGKATLLDDIKALKSWQDELREVLHGLVVLDLQQHFDNALRMEKSAEGKMSFDDLLLRAADLLRTDPESRERLRQKYTVILVDEVQDTDPVQAEVATLLSSASDDDTHWADLTPEPGRLFAVGDAKQSIYRFRGADAGTFERIQDVVARAGAKKELKQNFRSVPGIVDWVNDTFADLPAFSEQAAFRPPAELQPVVFVRVDDDEDEADAALRHVLQLKADGANVFCRRTKKLRPLQNRDVMLLLPAWTTSDDVVQKARAAGLPCSVEGGKMFYSRDEIRLSLAALAALEEPADSESMVFVLRGLFAISLDELAQHKQAGGSWRYTIPTQPPGVVADACAVFRKLRMLRGTLRQVDLLERILDESRAFACWTLLPDGHIRSANIEKLKRILSEAEEEGRTPAEALAPLRKAVSDSFGAKATDNVEKDLSVVDEDSDAIVVTSLFKAKGLEAPVVVLLNNARKKQSDNAWVDHAGQRLAVCIGDLKPPQWDEVYKKSMDAEEDAERRRWMYVAATRARDQLVVVGGPKKGLSKSGLYNADIKAGLPLDEEHQHGDVVDVGAQSSAQLVVASALPEVPYQQDAFPGRQEAVESVLSASSSAGDAKGEARAAQLRLQVKAGARGVMRWRSATEDAAQRRMPGRIVAADENPTVGAEGGTVVHQVLEQVDLTLPKEQLLKEADALLTILMDAAGLDDAKRELCPDIVRKILNDDVIDRVQQAPEHWKEVPFAYRKGNTRIITGTIDLCFPTDDTRKTWVVVDWKSHIPQEGTSLRNQYQEQLKHYFRAMMQTVGQLSDIDVETHLIGPHAGLEEEASVDDWMEYLDDKVLAAGVARLLELDAPMPTFFVDVEDADASVAVAWMDTKVGVGEFDKDEALALGSAGWTLLNLSETSSSEAVTWLAGQLGIDIAEAVEEREDGADLDEGTSKAATDGEDT